jgi:hypothetical protein
MKVRKSVRSDRAGSITRSERFNIQTPVRFRIRGEWKWRTGSIANISASGMLIRTEDPVQAGTVIEMRFVLPLEMGPGTRAAEAACRGVVVRIVECPDVPGDILIASKIESARLLRQTA